MKAFAMMLSRAALFAVIFICATVILQLLLRGRLQWSIGNPFGPATYYLTLCAATFAYRWLTVRFPGEKAVPTFQRQVEVFLIVWAPLAVLLITMKLIDVFEITHRLI
jgi:hypothetical protein